MTEAGRDAARADAPTGGSVAAAPSGPPTPPMPRRRSALRRALKRLGKRVERGPGRDLLSTLTRRLVGLLWRTCRLETSGTSALEALAADGAPFIACYWHGHQLFCVRALLRVRDAEPSLALGYLISPSRDGDAAAGVFADLDLHVIRGSATRGGAQALREIYLAIRQRNVCPVVTPDGPTGPARAFKPGVAMLASLAGVPVVPLAMSARPAATLGSWDAAIVPWPFARVHVAVGEPVTVPKGLDAAGLERWCVEAGRCIDDCAHRADAALGVKRAA